MGREVQKAVVAAQQSMMSVLPAMFMNYQAQMGPVIKATEKFYDENPEYVNMPKAVAIVASKIGQEMPNATIDQKLAEMKKRLGHALSIKKRALESATKDARGPRGRFNPNPANPARAVRPEVAKPMTSPDELTAAAFDRVIATLKQ